MVTGERQEGEHAVIEVELRTGRVSGDVMYTMAIPGRHMVLNSAAALLAGTPALEVRGVSNPVGPRDRAAWRIPEALAATRRGLEGLLAGAGG